ncbi:hypothetical protein R70331_22155 [Paenibacillus sp. FSL R7-0331]|nr:hypothetical protein R70331_22155 [Paenibacillus sp. FSL R7-0331]
MGSRLKYISVNQDLSIECRDIACEEPDDADGDRGIDYILERSREWNIKIMLSMGWHALDDVTLLKNTSRNQTVQALAPALKHGILVICANGNSSSINIMPPSEFLAVGGYNDHGFAKAELHSPHPDEPYGRNGDGHFRPDILAPRVYLPVPYCETFEQPEALSYFWGTSGASAIVAGMCAALLSRYPELQADTLRNVLVDCGVSFEGYDNQAPRVNAANVIKALDNGYSKSNALYRAAPIDVRNSFTAIVSGDPIERALGLTLLLEEQRCGRAELWAYTQDPSSVVRKIAAKALHKPDSADERTTFWTNLREEQEGGVRGWYAYGLLQEATENEVEHWIPWAADPNWSVRWCVSRYLEKFPGLPKLEMTYDPDEIPGKALPVLEWLEFDKKGNN